MDRTNGEFILTTHDGLSLFGRRDTTSCPKGVVVIVHGMAEHYGRYDHVAAFLLKEGYHVYRFDNRGHGKSGGDRGHLEHFFDYVKDLELVYEKAISENPKIPFFTLGHSMGGFISFLFGLDKREGLAGQVFSAAATDYNHELKGIKATLVKKIARLNPKITIKNDLSQKISRNESVVKAYQKDKDVFVKATLGFYRQFLIEGMSYLNKNKKKYQNRCLILHGGKDQIVRTETSQKLFDEIASNDKQLKIYDGLFHEILNEPEQEAVLKDIAEWLNQRVG